MIKKSYFDVYKGAFAVTDGSGTMHSIQLLRFIAAVVVVTFHAHLSFIAFSTEYKVFYWQAYWFGFGKVGVHIFFVISGYIMYLTSFSRPRDFKVANFVIRRFIRVYPIYWAFVALYLMVSIVLRTTPHLSKQELIGMLLLMPGNASMVIGPAWTLSFEIYFYLVFGAVMWLGPRRGTLALTGLFVASIVVGIIIRPASATAMLVTNALLIEFLMGVWIARLTLDHAFPRRVGWLALALALTGYALGLAWGYDRLPSAIIWGVPSALLVSGIVIVEQRSAGMPRMLRQLSRLGDSSYSLYLCHILLITLVLTALRQTGITVPLPLLVAVTTLGCIWTAAIFHVLVEKPLTGSLHRLTVDGSTREILVSRSNG